MGYLEEGTAPAPLTEEGRGWEPWGGRPQEDWEGPPGRISGRATQTFSSYLHIWQKGGGHLISQA